MSKIPGMRNSRRKGDNCAKNHRTRYIKIKKLEPGKIPRIGILEKPYKGNTKEQPNATD